MHLTGFGKSSASPKIGISFCILYASSSNLCHCSISIPSEYAKKGFLVFAGGKEKTGMEWIDHSLLLLFF